MGNGHGRVPSPSWYMIKASGAHSDGPIRSGMTLLTTNEIEGLVVFWVRSLSHVVLKVIYTNCKWRFPRSLILVNQKGQLNNHILPLISEKHAREPREELALFKYRIHGSCKAFLSGKPGRGFVVFSYILLLAFQVLSWRVGRDGRSRCFNFKERYEASKNVLPNLLSKCIYVNKVNMYVCK